MNNRYHDAEWSILLNLAHLVLALELIWPLPLLGAGIFKADDPLVIGIAVVLALMPWLARWLILGRPTRRASVGGALGLFVVSGLVGVWVSYDPSLSWPLLLTLLGSVSLFFAVVNTSTSPWRVASGLVIIMALAALYFSSQYAHFRYPLEVGRISRLARSVSSLMPNFVFFTPHPNAMAAFLEGALLLSVALIRRGRRGGKFVWGPALILIAYALLITQSRGSWVGLAAAIGIWVLLFIPNRGLRLAVGGVWLAVALVGVYVVAQRVRPDQGVFVVSSALEAAGGRLTLYRNSLNLLRDYPFTGVGLGDAFAMAYSRYQLLIRVPFLTYSHNLPLSIGLGQGALGLVALAWLWLGFYRFVIRVEGIGLSERSLPLFRAAWLGATASFIHGLTDAPQFSDSGWSMPVLFVVLGIAVAVGRPALLRADGDRVEGSAQGWRSPWVKRGVLVMMSVVALIFLGINWRPLASAWQANRGAIYQTRADLSPDLDETSRQAMLAQAIARFERALSLNPSQPVANRRIGMIASDQRDFERAVSYLERAYVKEPTNQATLKGLGLAYVWTGQLDRAQEVLLQVERQDELVSELGTWSWWWGTQDREDLSAYAGEMHQRLAEAQGIADTD